MLNETRISRMKMLNETRISRMKMLNETRILADENAQRDADSRG
jgi:hypothetical protein